MVVWLGSPNYATTRFRQILGLVLHSALALLVQPTPAQAQTQVMNITAYCCNGAGGGFCGRTASGALVRPGAVAAAPGVPFGSVVQIPGYGLGTVLDRGGAVGPGVLDVFFWNCSDAWNWGRRWVAVTWGWPTWEPAVEPVYDEPQDDAE